MLTNKQVNHLHEERNRIIRFTQELREMAGPHHPTWWQTHFSIAADILQDACYMIDKGILEGSAEDYVERPMGGEDCKCDTNGCDCG